MSFASWLKGVGESILASNGGKYECALGTAVTSTLGQDIETFFGTRQTAVIDPAFFMNVGAAPAGILLGLLGGQWGENELILGGKNDLAYAGPLGDFSRADKYEYTGAPIFNLKSWGAAEVQQLAAQNRVPGGASEAVVNGIKLLVVLYVATSLTYQLLIHLKYPEYGEESSDSGEQSNEVVPEVIELVGVAVTSRLLALIVSLEKVNAPVEAAGNHANHGLNVVPHQQAPNVNVGGNGIVAPVDQGVVGGELREGNDLGGGNRNLVEVDQENDENVVPPEQGGGDQGGGDQGGGDQGGGDQGGGDQGGGDQGGGDQGGGDQGGGDQGGGDQGGGDQGGGDQGGGDQGGGDQGGGDQGGGDQGGGDQGGGDQGGGDQGGGDQGGGDQGGGDQGGGDQGGGDQGGGDQGGGDQGGGDQGGGDQGGGDQGGGDQGGGDQGGGDQGGGDQGGGDQGGGDQGGGDQGGGDQGGGDQGGGDQGGGDQGGGDQGGGDQGGGDQGGGDQGGGDQGGGDQGGGDQGGGEDDRNS